MLFKSFLSFLFYAKSDLCSNSVILVFMKKPSHKNVETIKYLCRKYKVFYTLCTYFTYSICSYLLATVFKFIELLFVLISNYYFVVYLDLIHAYVYIFLFQLEKKRFYMLF